MVMIFLSRQVDALQRGIERGGFAAAGGPGDQKNAVRQAGEVLHAAQHVVVEAQPAQIVEIARRAVEQAHHHAFAVQRGQRGNAQIHFAAQNLDLDAAVLRQAALGDVQLGHQLQARNDGGLQLARRRFLIEQHAVHAEADAEFLLERLDVDVAGALFDGLRDHGVHQADDRRFAGHVAQVFEICRRPAASSALRRRAPGARSRRSACRWRRGFPARAPARSRIFRPEKARTAAMVSKSSGSAMASVSVESLQGQREKAALAQEAGRKPFQFGRGGRRRVDRDQRHAQLLGKRRQHVALGDEAHVDQDLAELVAALALQFERALEVFRLIELALDEHLAQP